MNTKMFIQRKKVIKKNTQSRFKLKITRYTQFLTQTTRYLTSLSCYTNINISIH